MRKFLGTFTALFLAVITHAQVIVQGIVTDIHQQPVEGANVIITSGTKKWNQLTTGEGRYHFTLKQPGSYQLTVQHVGKKSSTQTIEATNGSNSFNTTLNDVNYLLEPLEVRAVRAADKAPFTKTNISKADIAKANLGQDLPFILSQTPSAIVSSDAGNGVGYTALRIRGSDASRINVTMNGIPYNDAESQGSYFVDIPDLASSANSIQIQRGVGTSTNGAGAFGATINVSTNEVIDKPYAESNNSFGSFNTWKNTLKAGSGLINDHFTIDARLSKISSDGFIDRASTNLQSLYLSTAWLSKKTSVRFNLITGKEKTYQAWYGVPQDIYFTNRKYNPAGTEKPGDPYNNETDNYWQTHYQLFVNHTFNDKWSMNIASFLTRGKGYYEEYKAQQALSNYGLPPVKINDLQIDTTDLVRQLWLDNYFYGQVLSFQHKTTTDEFTVGGGWNVYDGKHYNTLIWGQAGVPKDYRYTNYPALKSDINIYAKWMHQLAQYWNIFGDVQYRHVMHRMDGFDGNPDLFIKRSFNFVNPKAGISYNRNGMQVYLSYALANKEPNRDDFQANQQQQPKYETLHDFELGAEKKTSRYSWGATVYYMLYNNQLVQTGKYNDVGAYTRVNVKNSYRLGLELQAGAIITPWMNVAANIAFSRNKIKAFKEYVDNYDNGTQDSITHNHINIAFSPAIVAGATVNFIPQKDVQLSFIGKEVSRQYLDNTQNKARSIADYYTQDFRAAYTIHNLLFSEWNIIAQVNNIFNRKYESSGSAYPYISGGETFNGISYFPMAGTNFMVALNVKF
ncbi:TonB-dependent receptor [Deminuibacter soli]|uniref:TonB-dependent receptor n=1 Tax=Deminuibacter soli TaxID=2291815 RepID=A0A3E1NLV6_9BACT|nr:TonB-dependent receptor [Deminuibacter soli]RFM28882.1 TonB-dependent receptor [Deminuibacter soli]